MSRRRTRVIICADCGSDAPNQGRALCAVCYSRHHHAGTLDAYQLSRRRRAVGDTCRNGHLIATEGDLVDDYRGGVTCRECRRETQAAYNRKRAGKPPRDCPRCGCSTWLPALCRDCREAAS